jgi:RNA polymerase sigma factor (sigma-70 family)
VVDAVQEGCMSAPERPRHIVAVESRAARQARLVGEIKALRAEGKAAAANRLANELIASLRPTLIKVARKLAGGAGSLTEDDLVQVGAIEAFKAIDTYDHTKRGAQQFYSWVFYRALRACKEELRLRANMVRASDGEQRGRTKRGAAEKPPKIVVVSTTRQAHNKGDDGPAEGVEFNVIVEESAPSCEEMFGTAQEVRRLRTKLYEMPQQQRDILCRAYGIGRPEEASERDLSQQLGVSRARVKDTLEAARGALRRRMERK